MPAEANFIANTTNWLHLAVQVGDEVFSMDESNFEDYERVLDMKSASLKRRLVFVTSSAAILQKDRGRWLRHHEIEARSRGHEPGRGSLADCA